MRPSPLLHPLAVLRQIIGTSQGELAQLVGKSRATIQAIELGKLNLSEELGMKIALETGVAVRWLFDGDPAAAPWVDGVLDSKVQFSKETFERRRARRAAGEGEEIEQLVFPEITAARFTAIYEAALEHPDRNLATYRVTKFLEGLEKEFGISKKRLDTELRKQELWRDFERLFEDPESRDDDRLADQREFVPAFVDAYTKLADTFKKRIAKQNFQRPGIFSLLRWAAKAIEVISPPWQPHKALFKLAKKKSSESSPSRP
jgi:transcriptional regulator with XRE-family HTH domain